MSIAKKVASHYDDAVVRLTGLKAIDANLDLGGGLTVQAYQDAVDDLRSKVDAYNTQLSLSDEKHIQMMASEKALKLLSSRFLSAVAGHYGRNSQEYAKAGGTRTEERRKTPISHKPA